MRFFSCCAFLALVFSPAFADMVRLAETAQDSEANLDAIVSELGYSTSDGRFELIAFDMKAFQFPSDTSSLPRQLYQQTVSGAFQFPVFNGQQLTLENTSIHKLNSALGWIGNVIDASNQRIGQASFICLDDARVRGTVTFPMLRRKILVRPVAGTANHLLFEPNSEYWSRFTYGDDVIKPGSVEEEEAETRYWKGYLEQDELKEHRSARDKLLEAEVKKAEERRHAAD